MANYYGTVWTYGGYLAHHGIKGQKWGIRRFQEEDGTLTAEGRKRYGVDEGGNKKLDRLYKRELKRLKKLKDNTDIDLQKANIAKYNKRAKTAAKVALASASVAAGTKGVNDILRENTKLKNDLLNRDWDDKFRQLQDNVSQAWKADKSYNPKTGYSKETWDFIDYLKGDFDKEGAAIDSKIHENTANFNKGARIRKAVITGAAAVAGVSAATAAYNVFKSQVAKRRISDIGHEKAVKKYQEQYNRVMNTFGGTAYSDLLKKEIEAYKREHPNSKLSTKQIANDLR